MTFTPDGDIQMSNAEQPETEEAVEWDREWDRVLDTIEKHGYTVDTMTIVADAMTLAPKSESDWVSPADLVKTILTISAQTHGPERAHWLMSIGLHSPRRVGEFVHLISSIVPGLRKSLREEDALQCFDGLPWVDMAPALVRGPAPEPAGPGPRI